MEKNAEEGKLKFLERKLDNKCQLYQKEGSNNNTEGSWSPCLLPIAELTTQLRVKRDFHG